MNAKPRLSPTSLISRRMVSEEVLAAIHGTPPAKQHQAIVGILSNALEAGNRRLEGYFFNTATDGHAVAAGRSYLIDQIIRIAYDTLTSCDALAESGDPTAERREARPVPLAIAATGGFGRGELAPFSDIDLLFLVEDTALETTRPLVEKLLYILWDLGLKVGHATRTPAECLDLAKEDLSICTSMLEARYLWGKRSLFKAMHSRFFDEVVSGSGPRFVEEKLAERDARHARLGESRYMVEPHIKDGKGGLRDLHTLWWIARYLYGGMGRSEAVKEGVLSRDDLLLFEKAETFFWQVRTMLHYLAGRAEERLTFDYQKEIAERLGYKDKKTGAAVEVFMKEYFLYAKQVGDLTRIFCAVLEEREKKSLLFKLSRRRRVSGFIITKGRLTFQRETDIKEDPTKMIRIFAIADQKEADIHPFALRLITEHLDLIDDSVRMDPSANNAFMDILCSLKDGEANLRRMNEAGVFGRFIPDFGAVVAQMQFDMYHHFTVDEHTIRAIGLLQNVEKGLLNDDHPLASKIIHKVSSRKVLYMAVLLHDIAKGRAGDHSILGAEVARNLCPRFGMTRSETETVAWLVRYHLLMSDTAFRRDVADHKTIADFCAQVKSPERLRLLLVLTVVDIRAVGPGVWNAWKRQLLTELYLAAEEVLVAGHVSLHRNERVNSKKKALKKAGAYKQQDLKKLFKRLPDSYWIAETGHTIRLNADLVIKTTHDHDTIGVQTNVTMSQDMTRVSVYCEDKPGVFARIVSALSRAGANIVDAKIHTTHDGWVLDNFVVQNFDQSAISEDWRLDKIRHEVTTSLHTRLRAPKPVAYQHLRDMQVESFDVNTCVSIDNRASDWSTVIEVRTRDRPGLLSDLSYCLYKLKLNILSAHVATYGERAVDVFYVQDKEAKKLVHPVRLRTIRTRLQAAAEPAQAPLSEKESPT